MKLKSESKIYKKMREIREWLLGAGHAAGPWMDLPIEGADIYWSGVADGLSYAIGHWEGDLSIYLPDEYERRGINVSGYKNIKCFKCEHYRFGSTPPSECETCEWIKAARR